MSKIVNLTPHAITFVGDDGEILRVIEPSGVVARVSCQTVLSGYFEGLPVTETRYDELENLPEPKENTIYLVSSLVASRCANRADIFIPNESVRDSNGRIIGCKSLGRV